MSEPGATTSSKAARYPPFARPAFGVPTAAADPPASDDHPAIELFLDELPSIDDYVADDEERSEWLLDDWQRYDWTALGALGRPTAERAEADAEWESTEWSDQTELDHSVVESLPPSVNAMNASGEPSAAEVANALDAIARRIRSGELAIDRFRGTPPEAAMAAAFAALLKMRG
jgi:hypothetical protein